MALFGIGAGSSLLAFPSAALYSHERCSSSARAHFTPVVVEFIGVYFLGVASVSCLASLKFSGIVVRRPPRARCCPFLTPARRWETMRRTPLPPTWTSSCAWRAACKLQPSQPSAW